MGLNSILKHFRSHPLTREDLWSACQRFIKWQLHSRYFPYPIIYPFIGNTRLIVQKGLKASTGNLYCGLQDFEEMSFLLHFLNNKDLFVDVGANIGTYVLLASGHRRAQSIAIEPIPVTHEHLKKNISINELNALIITHNIGLGAEEKKLKFTSLWDTYNNVISDDDLKKEKYFIEVEVRTLDSIVGELQPSLLKIDVEGFEFEVIKGGHKTLSKPSLKAIIIELNGSGNRYGFSDDEINALLLSHGFEKYNYNPFERLLTPTKDATETNAIYIRDLDFVKQKLTTSPKVTVLKKTY